VGQILGKKLRPMLGGKETEINLEKKAETKNYDDSIRHNLATVTDFLNSTFTGLVSEIE
jgi:hypothetical protein